LNDEKTDYPPSNWIRRGIVASILGCSHQTVINLEKKGLIFPKFSKDGFAYYDPVHIHEFARAYTPQCGRKKLSATELVGVPATKGARQARITELFDLGLSPGEIVKKLRVTYEEVHDVFTWMRSEPGSIESSFDRAERLRKEKKEHELTKIKLKAAEMAVAIETSGKGSAK
jgi:hypothetical protein